MSRTSPDLDLERIVLYAAGRYVPPWILAGQDGDDVIQAGWVGALKGVRSYDSRRGPLAEHLVACAKYAMWKVAARQREFVADHLASAVLGFHARARPRPVPEAPDWYCYGCGRGMEWRSPWRRCGGHRVNLCSACHRRRHRNGVCEFHGKVMWRRGGKAVCLG